MFGACESTLNETSRRTSIVVYFIPIITLYIKSDAISTFLDTSITDQFVLIFT